MRSILGGLVDAALELSVVGSFSSIGPRVRRWFWREEDLDVDLEGRVALVSGANSGLGFATTLGLATRGATVLMACRSEERGQAARERIEREHPGARLIVERCDVSSLDSIAQLAERVKARTERLDVLVHNAGALYGERRMSPEGHELGFATHVLGPFALTLALTPVLASSAPSRVIFVTSGGMYAVGLDVHDLQSDKLDPWDGVAAYARNKRAQVLLSGELARRLASRGITVNAVHPGWADTPAVRDSLPRFHRLTRPILRSWEEGAEGIVWLAAAPSAALETGKLFLDRRARSTVRLPGTGPRRGDGDCLWLALCQLAGVDPVAPFAPAIVRAEEAR